jgi:hypothetical protein
MIIIIYKYQNNERHSIDRFPEDFKIYDLESEEEILGYNDRSYLSEVILKMVATLVDSDKEIPEFIYEHHPRSSTNRPELNSIAEQAREFGFSELLYKFDKQYLVNILD